MDNLLITWIFLIVAGLSIDLLAYVLLRAEWKKSGVVFTDKFWNQAWTKLEQLVKTGQERLRPAARPQPALTPSELDLLENQIPVEIIPASVNIVDGIRQVEFSLEMQMNTTMEVRIGATSEMGVKVEKREI